MTTHTLAPNEAKNNPLDAGATFERMATHLHRGGAWRHFWTPNGGDEGDRNRSFWVPAGAPFALPQGWQRGKNCYFTVNPTTIRRKDSEASTNDTVAAVNALLMELDGKDFVQPHEWQPHYSTPDLTGLSKAKARGALQKAQTTAIDAAYKADPAEYKGRALAHVLGLSVRPSVAWDSGGGYQMVWLLRDTVPVTDANRAQVAHVQREWVHLHGGDPAATDLRRILRVPGSLNYKPKYAPNYPAVTFLWADLGALYTFDELAALVPPLATPTPAKRKPVHVPEGCPVDLVDSGDVPVLPQHAAINAYNRTTKLRDQLIGYGYTPSQRNPKRLSRPGGDTEGVELHPNNTAAIFSSADPLYGALCTPALAYAVYEHGGDVNAAMDALTAGEWGRKERKATAGQWATVKDWLWRGGAEEALRSAGVKRVDGYLRTLGAMIDHAEKKGGYTSIAPGMRKLAEAACCGLGTLSRHLATLFAGGLIDLHPGDAKTLTATAIDLEFAFRAQPEQVSVPASETCSGYARYRDLARDDAFQGGYRLEWARPWHVAEPTIKPLPPSAALAWAALAWAGPMTRRELADELGTTPARTANATRRLHELGLVEREQTGRTWTYTLTQGAEEALAKVRPAMYSFGLAGRRRYQTLMHYRRSALSARQESKAEAIKRRADELRTRGLAVGVDVAAKGLPVVRKDAQERGLVKAGTPEQWAQALQTARDRLYGHRLGEWAAEFAPDGTKRMGKRAYAQARARLEANFAPFFEWLQEAHGSKFVAMAERDIVAKCAEWTKTNAAPLRSSLPAKTTPAQVQAQAAEFGPMWWDFVDDLTRRVPEWRTHYTPEAAVSAFFDYCNAAPLPTFHFEAGAALAAD